MDPREPLAAASQRPARAQLEHGHHLGQRAAARVEHHPDAHNHRALRARLLRLSLPLAAHLRQVVTARGRSLIEARLGVGRAVVPDRRRRHQHRRRLVAQRLDRLSHAARGAHAAGLDLALDGLRPALCYEYGLARQVDHRAAAAHRARPVGRRHRVHAVGQPAARAERVARQRHHVVARRLQHLHQAHTHEARRARHRHLLALPPARGGGRGRVTHRPCHRMRRARRGGRTSLEPLPEALLLGARGGPSQGGALLGQRTLQRLAHALGRRQPRAQRILARQPRPAALLQLRALLFEGANGVTYSRQPSDNAKQM
mmetsp:Transcript_3177/g.9890  ORF Transcript_3177/g.9890 Transcript_3177/m.9890 type:complete len:315 (-) Transcript_3177:535-1479(-)